MLFSLSRAVPVLAALSLGIAAVTTRPVHADAPRSRPPLTDTVTAPRFFTGRWACAGGTPAGRIMNSDVVFASVLGARFLQSRHVDRAPGRYESMSMWPDTIVAQFTTVVYDNFGGTRRFHGEAVAPSTITLTRDTLETGARLESFTYRGTSDSTYWYAWYVRRTPGQPPVIGDSATCRRR